MIDDNTILRLHAEAAAFQERANVLGRQLGRDWAKDAEYDDLAAIHREIKNERNTLDEWIDWIHYGGVEAEGWNGIAWLESFGVDLGELDLSGHPEFSVDQLGPAFVIGVCEFIAEAMAARVRF